MGDFDVLEWSLKGFQKACGAEERDMDVDEADEEKPHETAFMKVLVNTAAGQGNPVVGMHVLAPHAGEIIQGYGVAMKMGLTFSQLQATVGIHPTVTEVFTTLKFTKSSGEDAAAGGC